MLPGESSTTTPKPNKPQPTATPRVDRPGLFAYLATVARPGTITKEQAREYQKRAYAARILNRDNPPLLDRNAARDPRLRLVVDQIELARKALNSDDLKPLERAKLLGALCSLLDRERILRGEPLPGTRRPRERSTERKRRDLPTPSLPVTPTPDAPPPTTDATAPEPSEVLPRQVEDPQAPEPGQVPATEPTGAPTPGQDPPPTPEPTASA